MGSGPAGLAGCCPQQEPGEPGTLGSAALVWPLPYRGRRGEAEVGGGAAGETRLPKEGRQEGRPAICRS